jgi:hypothetical protein
MLLLAGLLFAGGSVPPKLSPYWESWWGTGMTRDLRTEEAITINGAQSPVCDEVEACAGHLPEVTGSLSAKPGHRA